MRVYVTDKGYKHYTAGTELDITQELFDQHPQCFKPIVRVTAITGRLQKTEEEE